MVEQRLDGKIRVLQHLAKRAALNDLTEPTERFADTVEHGRVPHQGPRTVLVAAHLRRDGGDTSLSEVTALAKLREHRRVVPQVGFLNDSYFWLHDLLLKGCNVRHWNRPRERQRAPAERLTGQTRHPKDCQQPVRSGLDPSPP